MSVWKVTKENPENLISLDWMEYCEQYRSNKPTMVIVDFPEAALSSISCLPPFRATFPVYMDFGRSALVEWDRCSRLNGNKYKKIISKLAQRLGVNANSFAVESMGFSNCAIHKFMYGEPDPYKWNLEHRSALVPTDIRDDLIEYLHIWLTEMQSDPFCHAPNELSVRDWVISYKIPEHIDEKTGMAVWRDERYIILFQETALFSEKSGAIRRNMASKKELKSIFSRVREDLIKEKKAISSASKNSIIRHRGTDLIAGLIPSGLFPGHVHDNACLVLADSDEIDTDFMGTIYEVCVLRSEVIKLSGSLGFWNSVNLFLDVASDNRMHGLEESGISVEMARSKEYRDAIAAIERNCESYRRSMLEKYRFLSCNPIDRGFLGYLS